MPINQQLGDRSADEKTLLRVFNEEAKPVLKSLRAAWNRFTGLPAESTLTASGDLRVDWRRARIYRITLSSPVAEMVFDDPNDAGPHYLIIDQVGGGNTIGLWPSNVIWVGAAGYTTTATAGRSDLIVFFWDGTRYIADARMNAG